jgi:uncharacterized membrane protein
MVVGGFTKVNFRLDNNFWHASQLSGSLLSLSKPKTMNPEILILRLLHIFSGVFWAGGIFYLAFFIFPAVNGLGPDGGKFMQQLSRTKKMPTIMTINGLISVLAGLRLMMIDSANFQAEWFQSGMGLAITIGSVAAIGALIIGIFFNKPRADKMAKISSAVAASGVPPTPEQMQEIGKLKSQLEKGVKIMAWHLLFAVVLMATARYW